MRQMQRHTGKTASAFAVSPLGPRQSKGGQTVDDLTLPLNHHHLMASINIRLKEQPFVFEKPHRRKSFLTGGHENGSARLVLVR